MKGRQPYHSHRQQFRLKGASLSVLAHDADPVGADEAFDIFEPRPSPIASQKPSAAVMKDFSLDSKESLDSVKSMKGELGKTDRGKGRGGNH